MPSPVTVSIDVPHPRRDVYDHLDLLANHEAFTDHVLVDWRLSGPPRGVGAKVRVGSIAGGRRDATEIEVVEARPPERIVERNVSAGGARVGLGTYELGELPDGGTRVSFTFAWERAPLPDRLLAPLVRTLLRRANRCAMERLAERLATAPAAV